MFRKLLEASERVSTDVLESLAHSVDHIIKVVLDFAHQTQRFGERDRLNTDARDHRSGIEFALDLLKLKSVNRLENLWHVNLNFCWVVTIRQNVKQGRSSDEEESWEFFLLARHEIVQGFLANCQLFLNNLKCIVDVVLVAEGKSHLYFVGIDKNVTHLGVDGNELLALLGQLLLDLIRVHEERLQERPGTLDFRDQDNDVRNFTELGLPCGDFFFEGSQVAGCAHRLNLHLVFFEKLKVFLRKPDGAEIGVLHRRELELDI